MRWKLVMVEICFVDRWPIRNWLFEWVECVDQCTWYRVVLVCTEVQPLGIWGEGGCVHFFIRAAARVACARGSLRTWFAVTFCTTTRKDQSEFRLRYVKFRNFCSPLPVLSTRLGPTVAYQVYCSGTAHGDQGGEGHPAAWRHCFKKSPVLNSVGSLLINLNSVGPTVVLFS